MKKSCRRCGQIVDRKHECSKRPRQFNKRTVEEQGRYTTEWKHKSDDIKDRSMYLCAVCQDNGRYTYDNLETHHIIPLRERPDLLLNDNNLVCLCRKCHEAAECNEIDREYLIQLAQQRDKQ